MNTRILLSAMLLAVAAIRAHAAPFVPSHDDMVIETLPAPSARSGDERRLQRQLAQRPGDAALALRLARLKLERSRLEGDPRHAGHAMAALARWQHDADAPSDVQLMLATLQQHLHDFEGAAQRLERMLARDPRQPQGWLTLATVRRVQGRYDASNAACARLATIDAASPHAAACRAENDALSGRIEAARRALTVLQAQAAGDAERSAWLATTLAELEQRAGNGVAAEAAYRASLALRADPYTSLGYADLLLDQGRRDAAVALLGQAPRSDAVLLRLALADPTGSAADELRQRYAQAAERGGATHAREQAMFMLGVERRPALALERARTNVQVQREPADLLVYARAAHAAGDARAIDEARALQREIGLHDRRIDALYE